MKPIIGLVIGLFITGIILLALGSTVGNVYKQVRSASNTTDVYDKMDPLLTNFGKTFTVIGGIFMIAPFILFIVQVLYSKGYIGNQYGGGGYF